MSVSKIRQKAIAFCLGFFIVVAFAFLNYPVWSQDIRPETAAERVYQSLSFLPLGNEYLSQRGEEVVSNSTLMSRFIRYHEYVKSRPLTYRFDWQLTFADYFDINESISAKRYPGFQTLTVNPLESDRQTITSLTRSQRNQLIDTLLSIYNPRSEVTDLQPANTRDSGNEGNINPSLPQPGDAELLLPVK